MAVRRDDTLIQDKLIEGESSYRRRRSLKFREKQRSRRQKLFNDPFHKKDRNLKNANKVNAAKRRQRDGTGKFNFEESSSSYDRPGILKIATIEDLESYHSPNIPIFEVRRRGNSNANLVNLNLEPDPPAHEEPRLEVRTAEF